MTEVAEGMKSSIGRRSVTRVSATPLCGIFIHDWSCPHLQKSIQMTVESGEYMRMQFYWAIATAAWCCVKFVLAICVWNVSDLIVTYQLYRSSQGV